MKLMSKKIKWTIGISASMLLLSACSNVQPEDVAEANEVVQEEVDQLVTVDQKLSEHELNFNAQFQSLLTEDEELESLREESAEVLENITARNEELNQFTDHADTIQEKAEYITGYEGDELPESAIQEASDNFLAFSESIRSYQENYQESLDFQKDYLDQLVETETDYEDFIAGLNDLNANYKSLQADRENFDSEIVDIQDKLAQMTDILSDAVETTADTKEAEDADPTDEVEQTESTTNDEVNEEATDETDETAIETTGEVLTVHSTPLLTMPRRLPQKFLYDSGLNIPYPEDGVKGIYSTAHSAGGERMTSLIELINSTDLNSIVIDVKDDHGNITLNLNSDHELVNDMTFDMIDAPKLMQTLEENNIYPIARIVVFKDSLLAKEKPEWSFTDTNGAVWKNRRGESFVNPYLEEVWDYNIEVAIQAAKLGFKDIQYDYVRFPEGFENRADSLQYGHGKYADDSEDVISMEYRNRAVTEFIRKSKEALMPYGVDLSVDIFGYAAVVRETPGIGQSFPGIAKEVDVISSMIYPSHWGPGNLDISKPDLEPYQAVNNYMAIEQEIFDELGDDAPITRPWLQDFTASYLGAGNYKNYGAAEVSAQIQALADNNVYEFLLWNAGNSYSSGATYKLN